MYRRKINYLTKRLTLAEEKELYDSDLMDVNGHGNFQPDVLRIVKDPNRKDIIALSMIPGGMLGKAYVDMFIAQYPAIFRKINAWCIAHKVAPFFPDPDNITECLDVREDLLARREEEELNRFFGVEGYHDYTPPIHTSPTNEE